MNKRVPADSIRAQVLAEIDVFLRETGMYQTHLGERALGDGNFVTRFRAGATPSIDTVDRLRHFMTSYRKRGARRKVRMDA